MDPNFATPYAFQYDFQVQYQIGRNWLGDAAYVGSQGRKLENRRDINPGLYTPTATVVDDVNRGVYNINNPQDAAYGGAVFGGITAQLTDATSSERRAGERPPTTRRLRHEQVHCGRGASAIRTRRTEAGQFRGRPA